MGGIYTPQSIESSLRACRTEGMRRSFIYNVRKEWCRTIVLVLPKIVSDKLLSQFGGRALAPVVPLPQAVYARVWLTVWYIPIAGAALAFCVIWPQIGILYIEVLHKL